MQSNITIEPTGRSDLDQMRVVLDNVELFPTDMLEGMIEPYLNASETEVWLSAWLGDKLAGFTYSRLEEMTETSWNMLAIGVGVEHHRQGVGTKLLSATEQALALRGCKVLVIDTSGSSDFVGARDFYLNGGYSLAGRIPDFWGKGDDKVTFFKPL